MESAQAPISLFQPDVCRDGIQSGGRARCSMPLFLLPSTFLVRSIFKFATKSDRKETGTRLIRFDDH